MSEYKYTPEELLQKLEDAEKKIFEIVDDIKFYCGNYIAKKTVDDELYDIIQNISLFWVIHMEQGLSERSITKVSLRKSINQLKDYIKGKE